MTPDYTAIDAAICKEIAAGRNATHHLVDAANDLTRPLWNRNEVSCGAGFRTVDCRLQAMKKAGKISYARATGWVIV